jgi:hypothetical protein
MGILEIFGIIFLFLLLSFVLLSFLVLVYAIQLNNHFNNNENKKNITKPF